MKEKSPPSIGSAPFVGSQLAEKDFEDVRKILLDKRSFDLGMYKDCCIKRRIATRVRALGFKETGPYLRELLRNEAEVDNLMAALTIHVSQFFRNPSAFAVLREKVLPELLARAAGPRKRPLKLWSVGCSSGEEPYSLALLLDELAGPETELSILGTDISAEILDRARQAVYEPLSLTEVDAKLRSRYFDKEGRKFRLHERIRNMVRFKRQNILSAEKFPKTDLILCRNVLIYFPSIEQERIQMRFAMALPHDGFLVLGKTETLIGEPRHLFHVECAAERIYRRK